MTGNGDAWWRLPKALTDDILACPASPPAKLIMLAVLRWTAGHFNRCARDLGTAFLAEVTGLYRTRVLSLVRDLLAAGVLIEIRPARGRSPRTLALQTNPRKWGEYAPVAVRTPDHKQPVDSALCGPDSHILRSGNPTAKRSATQTTTGTPKERRKTDTKGRALAATDVTAHERPTCPRDGACLTVDWDGDEHCPICDWRPEAA